MVIRFKKYLQNNAGTPLALFSFLWYNDGIITYKGHIHNEENNQSDI